jgi:2-keto-4-pentenoate hydratase
MPAEICLRSNPADFSLPGSILMTAQQGSGKVCEAMSVSPARESVLMETATVLLKARRDCEPLDGLNSALCPADDAEAFCIQDNMAAAYGEIGGWKISSRGPEGVPFFAPMPKAWIAPEGALLAGPVRRLRGVEAEIAFCVHTPLPPRQQPYTRDEIIAAVTCHPAIELLESAYVDPQAVPRECLLADLQMHGGFVAGARCDSWRNIDWATEQVTVVVDGSVRVENTGSNPAGNDLMRLLLYLANEGAGRTGGLKPGNWITTGSWTGATWASPGSEVVVRFAGMGVVAVQFARDKA